MFSLLQIYRSYAGQVKYVTDFVRCAIVFTNVDELLRFIEVNDCFAHSGIADILFSFLVQGLMRYADSNLRARPFEVVRVRFVIFYLFCYFFFWRLRHV